MAWSVSREIQPGKYTIDDFNYHTPRDRMTGEGVPETRRTTTSRLRGLRLPGGIRSPGRRHCYVRTRIEELHAKYEQFSGSGNVRGSQLQGGAHAAGSHALAIQRAVHRHIGVLQGVGRRVRLGRAGGRFRLRHRGDRVQHSLPPGAHHAQADLQGPRRRSWWANPARRSTPTTKAWARQGPVPLGPLRQDGREQLVLDPRRPSDRRQQLGLRRHAPHGPRGRRRVPRGRPGPSDRHRQRLQRRAQAPPTHCPPRRPEPGSRAIRPSEAARRTSTSCDSRTRSASEDIYIHAEKDRTTRVKNDQVKWIGNEDHLIIKKDVFEKRRGRPPHHAQGRPQRKAGGRDALPRYRQGRPAWARSRTSLPTTSGTEIHLKSGTTIVIESGTKLSLVVGSSHLTLESSKITIQGPAGRRQRRRHDRDRCRDDQDQLRRLRRLGRLGLRRDAHRARSPREAGESVGGDMQEPPRRWRRSSTARRRRCSSWLRRAGRRSARSELSLPQRMTVASRLKRCSKT